MSGSAVTIYHNPACGTSRNALAMIRAAGCEPEVVAYLEAGWSVPQLRSLLEVIGKSPRELLREKEARTLAPALLEPDVPDDRLLEAMVEHPLLVNRPIVVTPKGAALCRPADAVLALLPPAPPADGAGDRSASTS